MPDVEREIMETATTLNFIQDIGNQSGETSDQGTAYLVRELLLSLGEEPDREGLRRTPERVAMMYTELLSGYQTDLETLVNGAIFESDYRSMVVVRNIEFFSLCEHHLLPFFGRVHVAYLPSGNIIGLSKIPRLVDRYARRLQVQERMTQEIAETLDWVLHPYGVAVQVEGAHLCAMMRGVKKMEASMVTSAFLGRFELEEGLRSEFSDQIRRFNS